MGEPAVASVTARSGVGPKFQFICDATNSLATRYGELLEAPWSTKLSVFERDLGDAADYVAVMTDPKRPAISEPEIRMLDALADQLLDSISGIGGDILVATAKQAIPVTREPRDKLADVAAVYRADAQQERKATQTFFTIAAVPGALAVLSIIAGILLVTFRTLDNLQVRSSSIWTVFSVYLVTSLVLLFVAGLLIGQGERHRRGAQEATRLARQFDAVESYLEPMEPQVRDLVRVSLTPRLFPRILWDDDPIREPIWPSAQDIVKARARSRSASPRASASG